MKIWSAITSWFTDEEKVQTGSHPNREAAKESLTPAQLEVYKMVLRNPNSTARELGVYNCPDDWKKPGRRMRELIDLGLVEVGQKRDCTITGYMVYTYAPKSYRRAYEFKYAEF